MRDTSLPERIAFNGTQSRDDADKHAVDDTHFMEEFPLEEVPPTVLESAQPDESRQARERCDQLIVAGEAHSRSGEITAAENKLREAAAIAEHLQDAARLTRIVLALPPWHWPGPGEANPLALLLAQRALVLGREDSSRSAILMARIAAELSYDPSSHKYSTDLADSAWKHVLAGMEPKAELYVRLYRDQVLRHPEHLSERLANTNEVLRLAVETGDYGACWVASFEKSSVLATMGEVAAAEHAAEFAIGIVQTSQTKMHHAVSAAYRAYRAVTDGRFADAAQEFGRCRALADAYNVPYVVDACWPAMLAPYAEEKRLSELEAIAEDTVRRRRSVLVYSALLSWLKAQIGCFAEASFLLERLAADQFATLSKSVDGLVGMAALACVCADLKRQDYAEILYDRLLPHAGLNAVLNAVAGLGSLARYLGILASALGRLDEAIAHFERSFQIDRKNGGRPWAIYSGIELATSLTHRGTSDDRTRALDLLTSLETEAVSLKMKRALAKLTETREVLTRSRLSALKPKENNLNSKVRPLSQSNNGAEFVGDQAAAQARVQEHLFSSGSAQDNPTERIAIFRRNGEYWQVGFEGCTSSIRHRRGLELIALLLRHPGRQFFAMELTDEGEMHRRTAITERMGIDTTGSPILDAQAKRSYRERLIEIRAELEKSHESNDTGHAAKLEAEQDFLTRELARAIGLFGRDRKLGSETERVRKRISIAISRAIRLVSHHDQHLGRYLERSIRRGNLCSYTPNPETQVDWRF